jgi:hypothetical protein
MAYDPPKIVSHRARNVKFLEGYRVAKKVTLKRSDFETAADYRRWHVRSMASRKSWKERKMRDLRLQAEKLNPRIGTSRKTKAELIAIIEKQRLALVERDAKAAMELLTQGWVDSEDIERLRKNMAIAVMPSRLRHLGTVTDEMEKMLKRASKKGERALRKLAKQYAAYFDVPLREVYTLFFSP